MRSGNRMYLLYSILLATGFLLMLPVFLVRREKYASGFSQRLGKYPKFEHDDRPLIWLHCVSVGETNAARPLVDAIQRTRPDTRLVVSTTTKTGQMLAREIFAGKADAVFYFPFDFKFSVRRALRNYRPSLVLLMETEIWPNFIREASHANARLALVNGRLSERSHKRYAYAGRFVRRVLGYLDLALMQAKPDASRIMSLGLRASKVRFTGNLKFDHDTAPAEDQLTQELRMRFAISSDAQLILAASTHDPEEGLIIEAFRNVWKTSGANLPRLMIAPRHPERFDDVAKTIERFGFSFVRRSGRESENDHSAEIILLDTIGELRSAYPLAELVFVGGSLIPHGGQSIFEPAAAGKAIVTGPHTANFANAVAEFLANDALIQLPQAKPDHTVSQLTEAIGELLEDEGRRRSLGDRALAFSDSSRGAAERSAEYLSSLLPARQPR